MTGVQTCALPICFPVTIRGGAVDTLRCIGFVNNSRQIELAWQKFNYSNLRSQCYFKLADYVNSNLIYLSDSDISIREKITEELGEIKQKDIDKDGKLMIVPKDAIKRNLGRSPDDSDCLMMRMYFEIKPIFVRNMRLLK